MEKRTIASFAVASCTDDGGIYKYNLKEDGTAEQIGKIPLASPMFFEVGADRLTVLLRAPFEDSSESGICVINKENGEIITDSYRTGGEVGCHIAVDGDTVYCANYISGSVFKSPDKLVVHEGHGVNPKRQESPHVHSVFFTPDKKYIVSCDLGTDEIYVYDRDLNEISRARVPDGAGARHVAFSKDGSFLYCINEMSATVSVFGYRDGKLDYKKDIDIKPKEYKGCGKGSAIRITRDGKRLYMTERGSETIVLADIDGENLKLRAHVSSRGAEPRDISLVADEKFLICTNQFSDSVSIYKLLSDGTLEPTYIFELPCPISVCEL